MLEFKGPDDNPKSGKSRVPVSPVSRERSAKDEC